MMGKPIPEEKKRSGPIQKKLVDHISLLASIVNKYHQEINCLKKEDGSYEIKPAHFNHVTRILLHEFFFYTSEPFSYENFLLLIEDIHKIAKRQLDNVHLVLSSFAVKTPDNKLLNMVLYVECGLEPKIHTFCKSTASIVDMKYKNISLFNQQESKFEKPIKHTAFTGLETGNAISNNNVFIVKTFGGAECVIAIDICSDHEWGQGKQLFETMLTQADTRIVPENIDHILVSNSCRPIASSKISNALLHVDPLVGIHPGDLMTPPDLKEIEINYSHDYGGLEISSREDKTIVIANPPFGTPVQLSFCNQRRAEKTELEDKNDIARALFFKEYAQYFFEAKRDDEDRNKALILWDKRKL